MLKSKNISVLAVLAVFATTPVFADIASTQYTERKTSVSDTTNAAVGKIAVYAADGSGQKIAAGMLGLPSENGTSGQVLKSNGAGGVIWGTDNNSNTYHSISVNGGTATTSGSVSLYAPTAAGTSGQVLIANSSGVPTWSTNLAPTSAGTSGNVWKSDGSGQGIWGTDADTKYPYAPAALGTANQVWKMNSGATGAGWATDANTNTWRGVTLNGTALGATSGTLSIYSPTASGTSGQVLKSNGETAAPTWGTDANTTYPYAPTAASGTVGQVWKTTASGTVGWANDTNTTYVAPTANGSANYVWKMNSGGTGAAWAVDSDTTYPYAPNSVGTSGQVWKSDGSGIGYWGTDNNTVYTLPAATTAALGGVKVSAHASDTTSNDTITTPVNDTAKNYAVKKDENNVAYVTVPWTDTNTQNTYTGSSPVSVNASTKVISHSTSGVTAATYGTVSDTTPAAGGTITIPSLAVNSTGHVTSASNQTITLPGDSDTTYPFAPTAASGTVGYVWKTTASGTVGWAADTDTNTNYYHTISMNGATGTTSGAVSFYAPSESGTAGQVLKSNGATAAPTWIDNYAPTTAGTSGYVWKSDGSGAGNWATDANTTYPYAPTAASATVGQVWKTTASGTVGWANDTNTTYSAATPETAVGTGGAAGLIPKVPFTCKTTPCSLSYGPHTTASNGLGTSVANGTTSSTSGFYWEQVAL